MQVWYVADVTIFKATISLNKNEHQEASNYLLSVNEVLIHT